jgi:hypothetical protein
MFSEKFGWRPINTAPMDKEVMLIVTDKPYAVLKPFKPHRGRLGQFWQRNTSCGHPLQWKPYIFRER